MTMTPEQARRRVTLADEEMVSIDKIVVGVRRREKLRGLEHLARSLETRGQIQPIGITEENVLVWGERRLEAAKKLGWTTIRCRRTTRLEPEDLRDLELDENVEREPYESHETTVDRARAMAAAEVAAREAAQATKAPPEENQGDGISSDGRTKLPAPRGRPPQPGSASAKAAAVGISKSTAADIDRAVALGERFPQIAGDGWSRSATLDAGTHLVRAHDAGHGPAAERLIEAQPPARATRMLATLEALPPEPQLKLVRMLESREPEQVRNVQAILIDKTPVSPEILTEWKALTRRVAELAMAIARRYPKLVDTMLSPFAGKMHDIGHMLEQEYSKELLYWEQQLAAVEHGGPDADARG